jgi:putative membrane protein
MIGWDGWGWGWMVLMVILMIAFWGGIIALIVWAVTRFTRREAPGNQGVGSRNPLDIAKERYARGEITKEQFDQIKRDLS